MKYRYKPTPPVEAITFDELVQHGRIHGANIVNGMPWSFDYQGWGVTHENDRLYLVCKGAATLRVTPDDMLVGQGDGLVIYSRASFESLHEPAAFHERQRPLQVTGSRAEAELTIRMLRERAPQAIPFADGELMELAAAVLERHMPPPGPTAVPRSPTSHEVG